MGQWSWRSNIGLLGCVELLADIVEASDSLTVKHLALELLRTCIVAV